MTQSYSATRFCKAVMIVSDAFNSEAGAIARNMRISRAPGAKSMVARAAASPRGQSEFSLHGTTQGFRQFASTRRVLCPLSAITLAKWTAIDDVPAPSLGATTPMIDLLRFVDLSW